MKTDRLHSYILLFAHAYMEYTSCPWLGKEVYRRSVDYSRVVWC